MNPRLSLSPRRRSGRRGSVLLVSLIFSIVIGISLVSFLNLATTASQLSYRTFYQGVAMNSAESGLEQALWEINNTSSTWSGWETVSTGTYRKSLSLGSVDGGATTTVKVYAKSGTGAYVIARAIVTPPRGSPIEKWIKVTLSKKSRYSVGGLGKHGIVANGNQVEMASWNSDPDKNSATVYEPFDEATNMHDKMPLATLALDASLNSAQADVNGTAAVGSDSLSMIKVGTQGFIGPFGTAAGTMDSASVSTNFSTDLQVQSVPTKTYTSLGAVTASLTLPRPGDTANADGTYYYTATQVSLTNATLAVSAGKSVVLNIPVTSGTALSVGGGSGSISVGSTLVTNTATGLETYNPASLKIYTDGDVSIGGQGSANEVTTQDYTPATTNPTVTTKTTTISNVTDVYGKGQYKTTVVGWKYTQTITNSTSVSGGTPTTTTSSGTYTALIANNATKPVAGSTTSTSSSGTGTTTNTGTQPGQPNNFWLIGTRSDADLALRGPQSFNISGNGNLSAVVDAPNASISAKGGGNSGFMYGSLIGYDLTFTGNDGFYYDESLSNLDDNSRLGIDSWDELVSTEDRAGKVSSVSSTTYASLMTF